MRSAKKYLVGLSTAAMVLGTVATGVSAASPASSPAFSDISGNAAAAAITFLAQAGIVNGTGNGQYSPSAPVTREQFAKIVVNLIGKGNVASALQNVTPSFTDAASIDSWAWGYVNVAADMGIVKGYPDGSFQPNAPVTDVEAAAMLIRAIGDDQPGIVTGTWPGNYVAAAYNLGLTNGVTFVANLPASRADIAQMAYNDVTTVKTAVPTTVGNTTTWAATGNPLYYSSTNGYSVLVGTVTGVSSSNITINNYNGTTNSTTKNWENNYQVVGVSNIANLLGLGVVALVDGSGNVSFLTVQSGVTATPNTGTLADGNTTVPSGFWRVSGAGDYVVTNNYTCSVNGLSDSNCSGNLYILLGGSTPTTVQLEGWTNANTQFIINVPSTGVNTDNSASVPDITYLNSTTNGGNADGDSVSYILDKNNKISTLYDTHVTISAGLVTRTLCPSGCDDTPANAGAQQNQIQINGTWYNVQSYTTLTLNGATATLSKSLDNAVAYANVVGNGYKNDINLASVALYQNTVSGLVTGVTTSNGKVSSITIQPSNGSAQTLSTDSNFSDTVTVGTTVTLALDSAGKVRAVIGTNATTTPTVALVTATGSTTTLGGTTTNTLTVNDSNGNGQTLNLYTTYTGTTASGYNTVYNSTYFTGGVPANGLIVFSVNPFGNAVDPVTASCTNSASSQCNTPEVLMAVAPPSGDHFQVYSATSNSVVIGIYNASGNLDYANSPNNNPFISVVNGGAFKKSDGSWLGFSGLSTGKTVGLWSASVALSSGTQTVYAIISDQ